VLGTHALEGGGTSPALPDVEEEDIGEGQAIPNGGKWIRFTEEWRGRLMARRQEGEDRKARERVAPAGRALPLLKRIRRACNGNPEDCTEFESTFQKQLESYLARSGAPTVTFCPLQ